MSLSTTPAQGMGPNYHWLHGLSHQNLLHCTEAEARKLAAVDELIEALQALDDVGCFQHGMLGNHPSILKAVEMSVAALVKVRG